MQIAQVFPVIKCILSFPKGWRAQFKEREATRVKELEELEDKCKEAKEHLFENNRKFSEATRMLAMREFDVEAATKRLNEALEDIKEHVDIHKQSAQQMVNVEQRGGKAAGRNLEKEQQIEAMTNQIEAMDDRTEDALRSIAKSELKREYILDQIDYWEQKAKKINEEVDRMNQEDWVSY
jgi:chromosome segregation ATPase